MRAELTKLSASEKKALYKKVEGLMIAGYGSVIVGVGLGGWGAAASVVFYALSAGYVF